jgi:Polyketide cyclase / dehydrase and lipid transport
VGSADYDFRTVWRVAGTPEEVADVLGDATTLPRWWPSVYLGVVPAPEPVDAARTGLPRPVALHTKGWLPYTLRWTLTVTEPVTNHGFALTAAGDLNGTGRWTFEQDGPETVITYRWRVRAAKPILRRLSWLLKPAFAANHRWAMARGEESLALELRRRRHRDEPESVPPPPPATFARLTRIAGPMFGNHNPVNNPSPLTRRR